MTEVLIKSVPERTCIHRGRPFYLFYVIQALQLAGRYSIVIYLYQIPFMHPIV